LECEKEYTLKKFAFETMIRSHLLELFTTLLREDVITLLNVETKALGSLLWTLNYISEKQSENITLEQVADLCHMNASYFSQYFKKNTGIGFSEYIRKLRITRSIELLASTDLSVAAIAEMCGYNSISNFYKAFHALYRASPNSYRKNSKTDDTQTVQHSPEIP
jgi:YesN/AraC family two-component response regulator